ncbi:2-polyprenyl-6-methoxyphenol hydroxylase [Echinicola sp. CAU 1574]|uniref:2-polyprenyl-6-methoxyphenol hydroxylase n=1 Tax=Echinicola arenosa TaxID=2774144 RepID=A0ABR9AFD5_9BACT|nr:2-polyprenyl-6-methoxyphenol hydroxylase [Echinicola arenosa]MBD8487134.1 2-polyprenyl-6-methoxyphenol hydroxylase [Echinicola arenosa]
MKNLFCIVIGLLLVTGLACSRENEEDIIPTPTPDKCADNTATLSGEVSTIIQNNCAVSGCHVAGTGRVNFTIKQNIIDNATQIRTYTQSGFMPPSDSGRSLTTSQKDDIFCWVSAGAQDN